MSWSKLVFSRRSTVPSLTLNKDSLPYGSPTSTGTLQGLLLNVVLRWKCSQYRRSSLSQSKKIGFVVLTLGTQAFRGISLRAEKQWAVLIKLFWHKLTYSFCQLYRSITMQQMLLMFIKWSSLQIVKVNLCQNSFMRLTLEEKSYFLRIIHWYLCSHIHGKQLTIGYLIEVTDHRPTLVCTIDISRFN